MSERSPKILASEEKATIIYNEHSYFTIIMFFRRYQALGVASKGHNYEVLFAQPGGRSLVIGGYRFRSHPTYLSLFNFFFFFFLVLDLLCSAFCKCVFVFRVRMVMLSLPRIFHDAPKGCRKLNRKTVW